MHASVLHGSPRGQAVRHVTDEETRGTNHPCLPRTEPVLTSRVPHPGKTLLPRQTKMVVDSKGNRGSERPGEFSQDLVVGQHRLLMVTMLEEAGDSVPSVPASGPSAT